MTKWSSIANLLTDQASDSVGKRPNREAICDVRFGRAHQCGQVRYGRSDETNVQSVAEIRQADYDVQDVSLLRIDPFDGHCWLVGLG